jgi:hypothetical protein
MWIDPLVNETDAKNLRCDGDKLLIVVEISSEKA